MKFKKLISLFLILVLSIQVSPAATDCRLAYLRDRLLKKLPMAVNPAKSKSVPDEKDPAILFVIFNSPGGLTLLTSES